jgi:hypothetical protein
MPVRLAAAALSLIQLSIRVNIQFDEFFLSESEICGQYFSLPFIFPSDWRL